MKRMPLLAIFLVLGLPVAPVTAQVASGTIGKALEADPQIVNAAQAVESELAALATKGETVRGASGSIAALLINADELICNSWLLTFSLQVRNLHIQAATSEDPQLLQTVRKMEELRNRIEKACQKITGAAPGGAQAVQTGGAGAEPAPEETEPGGKKRDPRYTVEEQICMDRCGGAYGDYLSALRALQRAEQVAENARADADRLSGEAKAAEDRVRSLEAEREQVAAELKSLTISSSNDPNVQRAAELNQRLASIDRSLPEARRNAASKKAEAEERDRTARSLEDGVRSRQEDLEKARAAYLECVERCVSQAKMAGVTIDPGRLFLYDPPLGGGAVPVPQAPVAPRAQGVEQVREAARRTAWMHGPAAFTTIASPALVSRYGALPRAQDFGAEIDAEVAAAGGVGPSPGGGDAFLDGEPFLHVESLGGSTGEVLRVTIVNPTPEPLSLHGFVALEPVAVSPKDAQKVAEHVRRAPGARATVTAAGYCLDFHKSVPPAGTVLRLAGLNKQERFQPLSRVLDAARELQEAGLLNPDTDPTSYFHSIRQWAVWTVRERFGRGAFLDAFVEHTRESFSESGETWSDEIANTVRQYGEGRWDAVQKILQAASDAGTGAP